MKLQRGQRLKLADLLNDGQSFLLKIAITAPTLELSFACFALNSDNKLLDKRYMTFCHEPITPCGAIELFCDYDSNTFAVDLQRLPADIERLVIASTIESVGVMSQLDYGKIELLEYLDEKEVACFEFTGNDFIAERTVILMEIYRKQGDWRIAAVGQGFNSVNALIQHFGSVTTELVTQTPVPSTTVSMIHNNQQESKHFWKLVGISLNFASMTIEGGLLYFGSGLSSVGNRSTAEPALIDPQLSVDDVAAANYQQQLLPYWSSYATATPAARAAYIKWLANGRCDPQAEIGYVFLYFYGLERRALVDAKINDTACSELPVIIQEIERLLRIYENNYSFRHYATGLAELLRFDLPETTTLEQYRTEPPVVKLNSGLPLKVKIALGQLALDSKPLPADWAYAWLIADVNTRLRTSATRCSTEFKRLFLQKYPAVFGNGIQLPINKTKIKISYQTASPSFFGTERIILKQIDIPDVSVLSSQIKKLQALADDCMQTLEAYSRFIGRNPDKADSLDALLELPYSLWSKHHRQHLQTIKATLTSTKSPLAIPFAKLRSWLPEWHTVTKARYLAFSQRLSEVGLGIEPDVRLGGELPTPDAKVVLFVEENSFLPRSAYNIAGLKLQLSFAVLGTTQLNPVEVKFFVRQIDDEWSHLNTAEKNRLQAHLRYLLTKPTTLNSLKKPLKTLAVNERVALGDFIADMARYCQKTAPANIKILEQIYKLLEIDTQFLYSKLHDLPTEPVTVRPASPNATGFAIPQQNTFQIDMRLVAARQAESEQVSALLRPLFEQNDTAEVLVVNQPSSEPTLLGLDAVHSHFLILLADKSQWTRAELEVLAAEFSMMLDGALEQINEAAFDFFDEAFIEGDDPIDLNLALLKDILA